MEHLGSRDELETLYDLTRLLTDDLANGRIERASLPNSRADFDRLLSWSVEFNTRYQFATGWTPDEYLSILESFYWNKVSNVAV
jgi:hypothetical protein